MNLSTWSIRNPIPALLLFILLTMLGLLSFKAMKIQNFPDIDLPTVIVSAALPGAAPAQLETEVARKLENSIATVAGIKHIYSKVQDGIVTVTAEFRLEKETSQAVDDVRDAVSRVRTDLPQDLREPIVSKLDIAGMPVLTYSIASDRMDEEALSWFVDNDVTRALLTVPGVGKVARVGGVQREVRVELDPARLQALNVTAAEISRRVRQVQQESSGGRANIGGTEQSIRTIGTVATAAGVALLEVPLLDGRRIRLDQVASVTDTVAERRTAALLDGRPVVGFEISRSRGASEVTVAEGVRARLSQMLAEHPGISITEAFNFVDPVEQSYIGSLNLLFEGAILAVIVVFLFLRDWRATFVAATALPLSIIPTFAAMYFMGFTINVVTLLAMSLVVGILVDDAIVEIENIVRHLGMGKSPKEAAMEAVEEIGLAVVATTATLVAVFLPTAFMTGVAGMFFKQFGWTAAIAVFASLVVARLLTPMMAAYILKPIDHAPKDSWVMTRYLGWVAWCLRHRILTSLAAAGFFIASLMLIPLLPTGFIPPDDLAQTQVTIELTPGSRFEQTLRVAEDVRERLMRDPDVRQVYTAIGGGATGSDPFAMGGAPEARKATLLLNLSPREGRGSSKQQIEARLREALAGVPGIRSTVGFGGAGEKLVVALTGDDGRTLAETSRAVVRELRALEGIGNVTSSAALTRPELVVRPDPARAADLGVTAEAIADTLRVATAGDYEQSLAKLNLSQRQVPIVVRLPEQSRDDLGLLERLAVPGSGGNVPLGNVADFAIDSGPAQIDRYDRSRNVLLEIELNGQALGDVLAKVDQLPSLVNLPPTVRRAELGDVEGMKELFESFGLAMLIGVFCIYTVLVLLFKDFIQPVTILAALVLSVPGAFLALFLTHTSLSMPSMIGRARLWQASISASVRLMPWSRRATIAYSTRRMEYLVATPISMISPISDGIEKPLPVSSKAANAPPMDSGSAARIVTGCMKSLNSSTSTV